MDSDKLKKQEYLKNEILNGGLDQNAFVQYLNDIKGEGNGTNVDNWEMDELVEVRNTFLSFYFRSWRISKRASGWP